MGSAFHRDNILNANDTEIGIGYPSWVDSAYDASLVAILAGSR